MLQFFYGLFFRDPWARTDPTLNRRPHSRLNTTQNLNNIYSKDYIFKQIAYCTLTGLLYATPESLSASVFLLPGNVGLRHALQTCADAGGLSVPVSTWPAPITQLLSEEAIGTRTMQPQEKVACRLLKHTLSAVGEERNKAGIAYADEPRLMTRFSEPYNRERYVFFATNEGSGNWQATLRANYYEKSRNHYSVRWDGSFFAIGKGNWLWSWEQLPRWWGPGWNGSLILSNNAEPVPTVSLRRLKSEPFKSAWLKWLGPWHLDVGMGRLEKNRVIPHALLFTARLVFKPTDHFEIGLSRAAQWGGEGRDEDFSAFFRMLAGLDNVGDDNVNAKNQPGNQLAGYDIRWVSPLFRAPYAIYAQLIGEDETGLLPYKFLALAGLEWWTRQTEWGSYRLYTEYADTRAHRNLDPVLNVAYEHSVYGSGYRYHGRSLGHGIDGDALMTSAGLIWASRTGTWLEGYASRLNPDLVLDDRQLWQIGLASGVHLEKNRLSLGWQWTRENQNDNDRREAEYMLHLTWERAF